MNLILCKINYSILLKISYQQVFSVLPLVTFSTIWQIPGPVRLLRWVPYSGSAVGRQRKVRKVCLQGNGPRRRYGQSSWQTREAQIRLTCARKETGKKRTQEDPLHSKNTPTTKSSRRKTHSLGWIPPYVQKNVDFSPSMVILWIVCKNCSKQLYPVFYSIGNSGFW